ncbi:MAG: hypothetical protein ABJN26_10840 [Stappiaceae bacterium]
MRIGFQAGAINERGMSVALHDYANAAQSILGHECFIFYDEVASDPAVVDKFRSHLNLISLTGSTDHRRTTEPYQLDFCYYIRDGRQRPLSIAAERSGVHAVFRHFEPHGDVYAYVSDWLAHWMSADAAPAVPHIVDLPAPSDDLRAELSLPKDAFVVGRYGGFDQFNVPFAQLAVIEALSARSNIHFVFVNTEKFVDHPRALFLPPIVQPEKKVDFIAACDVGLNAKKIGESFGLANAEFMTLGKPVFSWAGGMDRNHLHLSPRAEWNYRTKKDLVRLLTDYELSDIDSDLARTAMEAYKPAPVMARFEDVFLSGRYSAQTLKRRRLLEMTRSVEEKILRAKFKIWKNV